MKHKTSLSMLLGSVLLTACTNQPSAELELNTFDKKLSYMFAFGSASQVQELGIQFDLDVVRQAIEDVNNGVSSRMSMEEIQQTNRTFRVLQLEGNEK